MNDPIQIIATVMREKNLTRQDLVDAGVASDSALRGILCRKRRLDDLTAKLLAEALGIDPQTLTGKVELGPPRR